MIALGIIAPSIILFCISSFYIKLRKNSIQNQIINYINQNSDINESCIVSMKKVTKFEWDKMIMYQIGSSGSEISEILGVYFNDSVDLQSGIIFVKGDKVVYKESMVYNPENPYKLCYYVGQIYGEEEYGVFTPDNAIFKGVKTPYNNETLYRLIPLNESDRN